MAEATFEDRRLNTVDRRADVRGRGFVQDKRVLEVFAGGSFIEMIGGLAALVLTIIGLAGAAPGILASVAAICISAAIMLEGLSISAEFGKLTRARGQSTSAQVAGGMSAEFLAGGAGLALSILALVNVYPLVLLPIAAIVLGIGLALSSGAKMHLNSLRAGEEQEEKGLKKAVVASIGLEVIVGVAAVILGIIALSQVAPGVLSLVAFLILGAIMLIGGTALGGKLMTSVRNA